MGERVRVTSPGSWTHGLIGVVRKLNATAADGVSGSLVDFGNAWTVIETDKLTPVESEHG